jgi:hypothetical protein
MSQAKSRNNMPLAFSIAAEILAFDSKGEKWGKEKQLNNWVIDGMSFGGRKGREK